MTLDPTQIVVAGTGHIYVAPEGTTLPTTEAAAPDAAFIELGYATEDGVTFTLARDTDDLMGWQSADALRILTTAITKTIAFSLMQYVPANLLEAYGGGTANTTSTRGTYTFPTGVNPNVRAMVIDWQDGTALFRAVFARTQVQGSVETALQRAAGALLPLEYRVLASTVAPVIYGTGVGWKV